MTVHTDLDAANQHIERLQKVLATERDNRRDAEKNMKHFRRRFYDMRDRAELWESRAIRYSNRLNTYRIKNAPRKGN